MNDHEHLPSVTRVEVIDRHGRAFMAYDQHDVRLMVQDDGRTLKLFTSGPAALYVAAGQETKANEAEGLAAWFKCRAHKVKSRDMYERAAKMLREYAASLKSTPSQE